MPVTEPVNSPSVEELTVYPFNRMELRMAQSGMKGRSAAERAAISEMVRTRGAAYAARFRHATELSWRMPEMYWAALEDGRMTLDHMDAIWRRLDRHAGLRAHIEEQEAELQRERDLRGRECDGEDDDGADPGDQDYGAQVRPMVEDNPWHRRYPDVESAYCPSADRAVEVAVADWLIASPHRLITSSGSGSLIPRSTVTIHRLREVVDGAVDDDLKERELYEQHRGQPPRLASQEFPAF